MLLLMNAVVYCMQTCGLFASFDTKSQLLCYVMFPPSLASPCAFRRALNYLLTDPLAKGHRVDGIHLAIALYFTKVCVCVPAEASCCV